MNTYSDYPSLLTTVMLIAIESIGVMQWLKNFMDENGSHRIRNAIVSFIVLVPCALLSTSLVSTEVTIISHLILLSLAIQQLAYETVVKGIPKIVGSMFDKVSALGTTKSQPTKQ